ncbi:MAG: long-chain fatty acid transporter, partial [Alistipes sp.]|nr:long-chain fatty acid transporter [Alistipes sp.]
MRRYIITILAIAALAYTATAQDIGGTVLSPSAMTAMDMANMSRSSAGLGSARSAAMAGAFVSLGGDVSSMSQNPAGLG